MSRPKPQILVEHVSKTDYKTEQVLEAQGIYAVFYGGKPINLKSGNLLVDYPGPKYKKTSFANPGHAVNLAKKLNSRFKTDQFTVVLLQHGNQIYP